MYIMARLAFLVTVILFQICQLRTANYQTEMSLKMERNKALFGHSFLNISGLTMPDKCLEHCLKNCLCMSFQICDDTIECQLCSANKYLKRLEMKPSQGCTNYDFGKQEDTEVGNQQCGHSSGTIFTKCCMTSNPCLNGGTCLPPLPSSKKRFRCQCPDGFEGERCGVCNPGYGGPHCDQPIRSCRGFGKRSRVAGNYTVLDVNNNTFEVFCDFDRNSTMTWTRIISYSRENKNSDNMGWSFSRNFAINENNSTWSKYRLSKSRMESIQHDSTKWRVTCRYETDGVLYTDYLRVSNEELNILTFENLGKCVRVEYIDVRGRHCNNCTVYMRQQDSSLVHFFLKAGEGDECEFKPFLEPSWVWEDGSYQKGYYFGLYYKVDSRHRCSSSADATTQTWLGAED